ncbi:ATP-binding protein [Bradyrhizobium sp. CCGUVB23]|uniref:ATP-binding protein n=1 Tax=Bradyrhizobium sp. CCGUVB23 TaxID=2949630 RepID=UPI0020B297FC|nr:ATP-binding protein [Bradyrhizobium sp. CCGUVB23]MCP3460689.1 ATP-binding protein [Bradyrhizobium sp. CCGUVB23]
MRLVAFHAENIQPIKLVEADSLSDVVVLAGPNGVGKSRFLQWMLNQFQNPSANAQNWIIVDATSETERSAWGKSRLDTRNAQDVGLLQQTLQRGGRKRADTKSSLLNFESDRKITNIQPYQFSWDYADPFLEDIGWNYGFNTLSNRFNDTVHSIFRKVRSRRENISLHVEEQMRTQRQNGSAHAGQEGLVNGIIINPDDFPDPLVPFKEAFARLLSPKQLEEPDPKKSQLFYEHEGQSFPITALSSGEREVVNIVFDFLLRNPSDCIVVFDEPELHLHPELSYRLIQTLRTAGARNQFIFCTHSAEIISASLDNSVIFIAPPKQPPINQAIRVTENDDTHQALRLVGQSIGIVALGKKIVLIEGQHGSLDKQTYGAVLRGRFPDLVLVPSGGKGFIQSFGSLNDLVLKKTIWGVSFFMLCDADAVPPSRDLGRLTELSQGRMQVLKRYHLENYFLDAEVIARIFEPFETEASERSWLRDPVAIDERLKTIAREILSYAAALVVSAHFRERAGNVDLMPKGCQGKTTDELIALFEAEAASERLRLNEALSANDIAAFTRQTMTELETSLSDGTWRKKIPGRPILQIFCSNKHCGLDFGRFKNAFVKAAEDMASSPFAEIEEIFARFSEFNPAAIVASTQPTPPAETTHSAEAPPSSL